MEEKEIREIEEYLLKLRNDTQTVKVKSWLFEMIAEYFILGKKYKIDMFTDKFAEEIITKEILIKLKKMKAHSEYTKKLRKGKGNIQY